MYCTYNIFSLVYCRTHKRSRRYEPIAVLENGVIPKNINCEVEETEESPKAGPKPCHMLVSELTENGEAKEPKKRAPVKLRLFKRRNSSTKRKSKIEFDADDFDVDVQRIPRVKKRVAFEMKSKSDWNIILCGFLSK